MRRLYTITITREASREMDKVKCPKCQELWYPSHERRDHECPECQSSASPADYAQSPLFELVQLHEYIGHAEVVVHDKNGRKVYAGNIELQTNPDAYYST